MTVLTLNAISSRLSLDRLSEIKIKRGEGSRVFQHLNMYTYIYFVSDVNLMIAKRKGKVKISMIGHYLTIKNRSLKC